MDKQADVTPIDESSIAHFCNDYMDAENHDVMLPMFVNLTRRNGHPVRAFHQHHGCEIAVVVNGRAQHLLKDVSAPIDQGDVLVIPRGVSHSYDELKDFQLLNLVFNSDALPLGINQFSELPLFSILFPVTGSRQGNASAAPIVHLADTRLSQLKKILLQLRDELESFLPGKNALCMALFTEAIILLSREYAGRIVPQKTEYRLSKAMNFITQHYRETIDIQDLCRQTNMSRRNLHRCFQQSLGITPIQYLTKYRLLRVKEMLLHTDQAVTEIAFQCGFKDSNYLSKVFHDHFSCSIRSFRKNNAVDPKNEPL